MDETSDEDTIEYEIEVVSSSSSSASLASDQKPSTREAPVGAENEPETRIDGEQHGKALGPDSGEGEKCTHFTGGNLVGTEQLTDQSEATSGQQQEQAFDQATCDPDAELNDQIPNNGDATTTPISSNPSEDAGHRIKRDANTNDEHQREGALDFMAAQLASCKGEQSQQEAADITLPEDAGHSIETINGGGNGNAVAGPTDETNTRNIPIEQDTVDHHGIAPEGAVALQQVDSVPGLSEGHDEAGGDRALDSIEGAIGRPDESAATNTTTITGPQMDLTDLTTTRAELSHHRQQLDAASSDECDTTALGKVGHQHADATPSRLEDQVDSTTKTTTSEPAKQDEPTANDGPSPACVGVDKGVCPVNDNGEASARQPDTLTGSKQESTTTTTTTTATTSTNDAPHADGPFITGPIEGQPAVECPSVEVVAEAKAERVPLIDISNSGLERLAAGDAAADQVKIEAAALAAATGGQDDEMVGVDGHQDSITPTPFRGSSSSSSSTSLADLTGGDEREIISRRQYDDADADNGQLTIDGQDNINLDDDEARSPSPSPPPLLQTPKLSLNILLPQQQQQQLQQQQQRRRPSVVSSTFGDDEDLEREFDEEPEFERRQVSVKRNRNPRTEYQLGAELGRGKFGTVYRCTELASGRQLAAKFVFMRRQEDRQDVEREVAIMSRLQHKRLLQLYDAFDDGLNEMCLVTELVEGGELFERIVDDDFELTEKKAAIFMRQICEGVEYMHGQRIVHLDMKPENILCLSRTGNRIKLIDFGLARQLEPHQAPLRVMFGTPDFAAPEVLGYEPVTLATDMWSVGVICYVLLSGLSPFMGDNDLETMANVTKCAYDFESSAFEPISDLAKDFISKLLVREPDGRLKPGECLQHAWLQRGGHQLEAAVRERRESNVAAGLISRRQSTAAGHLVAADQLAREFGTMLASAAGGGVGGVGAGSGSGSGNNGFHSGQSSADTTASLVSLDKRNLKKYVVRRKWHKTVAAIMALNRMGANLKLNL